MNIVKENKEKKVTNGQVLNEIFPMLQTINQMQMSGALFMPPAVSYAMGKNFGKCESVFKSFNHHRKKHADLHVQKDENGKYKFNESDASKFLFIDDEHAKEYRKAESEFYAQEVVDWNPAKCFEGAIAEVQNLPIAYLTIMEEYGMISQADIVKASFGKQPVGKA